MNNTDIGFLAEPFREKAIDAFEALFEITGVTGKNWNASDSLRSTFDYLLIIKSTSQEYVSTMVVGVNIEQVRSFFKSHVDESLSLDVLKDALTEFGNIYCGLLNDIPAVRETWGTFRQKPPQEALQYAFFSQMDVIDGTLIINGKGEEIYVGYGVRPNTKKHCRAKSAELNALLEDL